MKNILVMAGIGAGLFSATLVGLLAAQGRLDYAGTRGIPVLSLFFAEPAPAPAPAGEATGAHKDPGPGADKDHEAGTLAEREKPLPFRKGQSILNPPKADDGGHGAAKPADEHQETPAAHAGEDAGKTHAAREKPSDWEHKVDDLLGQGQYRKGRLFNFPRFDAAMTVDELNATLGRVKELQAALDRDQKSFEKRKGELDAREADVRDRQKAVADKMAEVLQERAKLEREVEEFHRTVLLIRQDEERGLKEVARTVASLQPSQASSLILQMWQTQEGQVKAMKVLSVMDPEAADAIVGEFQVKQIQEFVEKRLKVVREEAKKQKN